MGESMRRKFLTELYNLNGKIRIYHFTKKDMGDEFVLDPKETTKQRSSYSKNEYKRTSFPRVFYYLDLNKTEDMVVSEFLYSTEVKGEDILDLTKAAIDYKQRREEMKREDPRAFEVIAALWKPTFINIEKTKFTETVPHWDEMFEAAAKNYIGIYYSPGGDLPMVNIFKPLKVKRYVKR